MDERSQAIFDKLGRMAMAELSRPEAAEAVGKAAQANGAAPAIAEALQAVMGGIVEAARAAKVEIEPEAVRQAQMAIAGVLATMMAESGLADDPEAVMAEIAQMMGGEVQEAPDTEEPGEAPEPGEMEDEPRRPGALAAMGGM